MRELIFESWSLFIDFVDFNFKLMEKKVEVNGGLIFENKKYSSYETFFNEQYEIYKKILLSYIEDEKIYL